MKVIALPYVEYQNEPSKPYMAELDSNDIDESAKQIFVKSFGTDTEFPVNVYHDGGGYGDIEVTNGTGCHLYLHYIQ